jgi:hypothetical protein
VRVPLDERMALQFSVLNSAFLEAAREFSVRRTYTPLVRNNFRMFQNLCMSFPLLDLVLVGPFLLDLVLLLVLLIPFLT